MAMPPMLRWALKRLAAAQRRAAAARARRARRQGLCHQSRTPPARRRRQRQRQIRGAAGRRHRRLRRQADHDSRSERRRIGGTGGKKGTKKEKSKPRAVRKIAASAERRRFQARKSRPRPRRRPRWNRIPTRKSRAASMSSHGSTERSTPKRSPARRARATTSWSSASPRRAIPRAALAKTCRTSLKDLTARSPIVNSHHARPTGRRIAYGHILIPVNGTDVSRRAVEVGLALARATGANVTGALCHARERDRWQRQKHRGGRRAGATSARCSRKSHALAERYEVELAR